MISYTRCSASNRMTTIRNSETMIMNERGQLLQLKSSIFASIASMAVIDWRVVFSV